jgi:hypothetical protein
MMTTGRFGGPRSSGNDAVKQKEKEDASHERKNEQGWRRYGGDWK